MDHRRDPQVKEEDLPSNDRRLDEKGEKAREELDEIPAPGTDPLHEGP